LNRYKVTRWPEKSRGFTLIEVLVVVACVGILALIFLPKYWANRPRAMPSNKRTVCQNNLKQIGFAFRTWEGDHGDKYPMSVATNKGGSLEYGPGANMFRHFQVMSNELDNPRTLRCPADQRTAAVDFNGLRNSNVSYFVGLDADETFPAMPLAGDRNLVVNGVGVGPGPAAIKMKDTVEWSAAIHHNSGSVLLADGSVQLVTNTVLPLIFRRSGSPNDTNRLAMP
jgi:prepilin-type N-terminal cleavage/methylation domain-containing protein